MPEAVAIVCLFTFLIHITETLAYSIRVAGLRTKQIAIAMSFVTSTLLISRLSNMFQAPLIGNLVDQTIILNSSQALMNLETHFRSIIFAGFIGSLAGAFLTPTAIRLFQKAIMKFLDNGSVPKILLSLGKPKNIFKIITTFRLPNLSSLRKISLKNLPKTFLLFNIFVSSIYTIGVLCSLLAGAFLPDLRATAIQLSGIVNGIATILFTLVVDPSGARITDQAVNGNRRDADVVSVVFFMQMGRLLGTLVIAQLMLKPFTHYIMWITKLIGHHF